MSILLHEKPEDYIASCRQFVIHQQAFVSVLTKSFNRHRDNCEGHCSTCESFVETIMTNEQILDQFNARYHSAEMGIYE